MEFMRRAWVFARRNTIAPKKPVMALLAKTRRRRFSPCGLIAEG
jgi:hypothetical protein